MLSQIEIELAASHCGHYLTRGWMDESFWLRGREACKCALQDFPDLFCDDPE